VASAAALWCAALRTASTLSPGGLERVVAAAPLAVGAAIAEALALGIADLGGSPLALAGAAGLTWLAARLLLPAPELPLVHELRAWASAAGGAERAGALALAGAGAGYLAWALRHPFLGLDGATYHLSAVVTWVQEGSPGAEGSFYAQVPTASYPLSGETAIAWAVGIAGSLAPVALWTAGVAALLLSGGWLGLRTLGVPRALAALALAALLLVPVVLRGTLESGTTDVPALAWLVVAAALGAAAQSRPALLAPALVAGALAIGTKTTAAPLALLALGLSAWGVRGELRTLARPLAAAAALALVAGGTWYLRNLVSHGSPLWPFISTPWGDPVPEHLDRLDFSFIERPRQTLEGNVDLYRQVLAGALLLLAGGLAAPAWARHRRVLLAAGATLAAVLIWSAAPFTGAGAAEFLQLNTVRYLMPAFAAGALTLALSGALGRRGALWLAGAVLGLALAWSARRYGQDPYLPSEWEAVAAGLAVALVLALAARVLPAAALLAAALTALALALAAGASGWVERHSRAGDFDAGVVTWFSGEAAWRDGKAPIAFSPTPVAALAGDELTHPLRLVAPGESCARVRRRLAEGWVVVRAVDRRVFGTLAAERCLERVEPRFSDGIHSVYGGPAEPGA
jgi:hypothetical protein